MLPMCSLREIVVIQVMAIRLATVVSVLNERNEAIYHAVLYDEGVEIA